MQIRFSTMAGALTLLLTCSAVLAVPPKPGNWNENDQNYGLFNVHTYLPKQVKPGLGKQRALMVVLHGCKQTVHGDIMDKRPGWESVAEQ